MRVQAQVILDSILEKDNVATAICVNTGSSTFTMTDGATAKVFGIMFTCAVDGGCSDSLNVGVTFFGSTMEYSSNNWIWKSLRKFDTLPCISVQMLEMGLMLLRLMGYLQVKQLTLTYHFKMSLLT
ncbi:unnamed protein product [Moneuplotes crassus]|uniref:Uncharacterized protein n=1 Tax=Euplotes crassus TaxID=5936 RepID=A0AAD1XDQ9_EUPCR|nr:unnamed protein product [Moneuplotes crassus]